MVNDVASLSYFTPIGTTASLPWAGVTQKYQGAIPTVATISFVTTIGLNDGVQINEATPINIAASNIYSYVRYTNSGARNYDKPDLMMYLLASDSLYTYVGSLIKIYSAAMTYSSMN